MPPNQENQQQQTSPGSIEGAEGELSKDPNELKKQRRLIRNRMSAQLHRERKKVLLIFLFNIFKILVQ